jgi:uncharacterized damage-inducible protein DinB
MHRRSLLFAFLIGVGFVASAFVQSKPGNQPRAVSQVIDALIRSTEKDLIGVAETMPDDAYEFAPTNGNFRGVRNFAKQVKHAAAVHNLIAASILGEPISADVADERGPDSLKTKAEILKYLKDSFAYLHRAVSTIDESNAFAPFGQTARDTRMGLTVTALSHSSNHYGQMVEYLRMKGLAPPQSQ